MLTPSGAAAVQQPIRGATAATRQSRDGDPRGPAPLWAGLWGPHFPLAPQPFPQSPALRLDHRFLEGVQGMW